MFRSAGTSPGPHPIYKLVSFDRLTKKEGLFLPPPDFRWWRSRDGRFRPHMRRSANFFLPSWSLLFANSCLTRSRLDPSGQNFFLRLSWCHDFRKCGFSSFFLWLKYLFLSGIFDQCRRKQTEAFIDGCATISFQLSYMFAVLLWTWKLTPALVFFSCRSDPPDAKPSTGGTSRIE